MIYIYIYTIYTHDGWRMLTDSTTVNWTMGQPSQQDARISKADQTLLEEVGRNYCKCLFFVRALLWYATMFWASLCMSSTLIVEYHGHRYQYSLLMFVSVQRPVPQPNKVPDRIFSMLHRNRVFVSVQRVRTYSPCCALALLLTWQTHPTHL